MIAEPEAPLSELEIVSTLAREFTILGAPIGRVEFRTGLHGRYCRWPLELYSENSPQENLVMHIDDDGLFRVWYGAGEISVVAPTLPDVVQAVRIALHAVFAPVIAYEQARRRRRRSSVISAVCELENLKFSVLADSERFRGHVCESESAQVRSSAFEKLVREFPEDFQCLHSA